MKKIIMSLGLLTIASISLHAETLKEQIMNSHGLTASQVRVIQAAKGASDQDLKDAFGFSEEGLAVIRTLTPEDLLAMQKKREEQKKAFEEMIKENRQNSAERKKKREEAQRSPKAYVLYNVGYPAIMLIRNAQNVSDDLLAEVLFGLFDDSPEGKAASMARLKAARDLTPEEVGQSKKEYEQKKVEMNNAMQELKEAMRKHEENKK